MRLRAWPTLVALVAAGLLTAQSAAVAQSVVPFHADSGDSCRRGLTEGSLEWVEGPVIRPTVRVEGYLSDEAHPSICQNRDGMYSTATFTAYNGSTIVDYETYKADDEQVKFSFALSDPTGVTAIDRVVVGVCRFNSSPIGISYCGSPAEYKMP
ncbi:hypothetical protein [Nonomuraea sp. SYSU D8015]|uniref:hypothetical protein n=1 Tax=Nonomuraea sp. SYSU D8015 TaxID=2593644 RepID=UPI001660CAC5|nr:hypothetical protein [Nonomuraea sp. SYSU D8015]